METNNRQQTDNQQPTNTTAQKTRIYNLIILDKSGSMSSIRKAAYEGCNEVLGGIRAAAEKHADEQEQLVSLLLFDSDSMPYIHKCTPAKDAADLTADQYRPCACTPLLDAMGMALTELEHETEKYDDAVGMVTIITDGYENASQEWTYPQIQQLVGKLKAKGWNFAFMGANQDVTKVCIDLNINVGNAHAFSFDDAGMRDSWEKDRMAKERYFARMAQTKMEYEQTCMGDIEALHELYRTMNEGNSYFEEEEK